MTLDTRNATHEEMVGYDVQNFKNLEVLLRVHADAKKLCEERGANHKDPILRAVVEVFEALRFPVDAEREYYDLVEGTERRALQWFEDGAAELADLYRAYAKPSSETESGRFVVAAKRAKKGYITYVDSQKEFPALDALEKDVWMRMSGVEHLKMDAPTARLYRMQELMIRCNKAQLTLRGARQVLAHSRNPVLQHVLQRIDPQDIYSPVQLKNLLILRIRREIGNPVFEKERYADDRLGVRGNASSPPLDHIMALANGRY